MRHLAKLGLPVIVAIIMVLGTVGIVVAGFAADREIVLEVSNTIDIQPNESIPLEVFRGASNDTTYTCTNNTDGDVDVEVTCKSELTGITLAISPETFHMESGGKQDVNVNVEAGQIAENCTLAIHFAVV